MRLSTNPIAALAVLGPVWLALIGIAVAADVPSYKPPSRGAPSDRVGGGTRGIIPPPQIWAMAPDPTGLTTREQPSLYWYLPRRVATHLEIMAVGDQVVKPLLAVTIASPAAPGVQRLDLVRHGVRLQPGVQYRWNLTFENDPKQRSNTGWIQRIEPGSGLAKRLESTPKTGHAALYAAEGIW